MPSLAPTCFLPPEKLIGGKAVDLDVGRLLHTRNAFRRISVDHRNHRLLQDFVKLTSAVEEAQRASLLPGSRAFLTMPEGHETAIEDDVHQDVSTVDTHAFLAGLMPKKEIGAESFLEKHPHYDGRGIIIAIFDSGVDPAAAGLQTTSDGRPKLLDLLDCTGSGDVDTSKVVKVSKDGCIMGASGKQLQLNEKWKNPSGEWRVGYKLAYELFTETLVSRLKLERKKKWEEKHKEALTEALRQLAAFDQRHAKPLEFALKKDREDLQNRVDLLQKLSDNYEDNGPIIDAVVWNDGEHWRVALDTQDFDDLGQGKLADFTPLTNYRIEQKYGIFSKMDACSFVTNVYDNGNVLSIVTDSSPHGTHVAAITAAYHPEEPLLCGVAPGAQLISCKIGDSRLQSMETGTGLTRAFIAVLENKCHLINMSYGEPTMRPDSGRFINLANEVVNKHGVVFVSSAGNAGPSLNTVGAPGGTTSSIIGIGAYVSPIMATATHSMVEPPLEGLQYTWSSRGPTADGDLGVCLSAPGAAVAPVPQWTLQRRMFMNGTSMASPCACGAIALVLSALKAEGQLISPWLVRKALENTAAPVSNDPGEPLTTGRGLLQVEKAYEYLQRCKGLPSVWYQVRLNRNGNSGSSLRGVYLRESFDCHQASEWSVEVKPRFHEDADKLELLVPFEEQVQLKMSDAAWVKTPEYVLLTHNGRTFNIVVDPTGLAPGLHYTEIHGIDCDAPWRGPIFRIPVTVLKPIEIINRPPSISFSGLIFIPGHIERRFIEVPNGSTWAESVLKVAGFDTPRRFTFNAVQIVPQKRPIVWESRATFSGPSSKSFAFCVEGGVTMELTLAQFWSSGSGSHVPATVEIEIEFHGLLGRQNELTLNGMNVATRIDVKSTLGPERLAPKATLTKVRTPYRPIETKMEPLPADRDKLPNGRQILVLTLMYKFSLLESCKVTPRVSLLNNRVYDSEIESQFYMIANSNKRVVAMGDTYPKGVRLSKGEYTLRLFLRHDHIQYLEKLKNLILYIDRHLEEKSYIRLAFYSYIDGAVTGSDSLKPSTLIPGEERPFYVASPTDDKLPKDAIIGTSLIGRITYGRVMHGHGKVEENGQACPAYYQISYVVPPAPKTEEKSKDKNGVSPKKTASQVFEEEVRDAKIKVFSTIPRGTLEERKEWNNIAAALKAEYPKHLQLMTEVLQKVAATQQKEDGKIGIQEVITAADEVLSLIDKDVLAKYFGLRSESEDPDAAQIRKEMEMQRDSLADALYRKGLALAELEDQSLIETLVKEQESKPSENTEDTTMTEIIGSKPLGSDDTTIAAKQEGNSDSVEEETRISGPESQDRFEETFVELRKWVDIMSPKYSLLTVIRERRCKRMGTSIKVLNELIQDEGKPPQKNLYELRVQLLDQIGWSHWAEYERKWTLIRFPPNLPLF